MQSACGWMGLIMTIASLVVNNHRKAFVLKTKKGDYPLPFSRLPVPPTRENPVRDAYVDPECAHQAFRYVLADGSEDIVPLDAALDYNRDPDYMRDLLLHNLTCKALDALEQTPLSKREITRRLGTSASQFYRLIDTTNYSKTVDQMVRLLQALDCQVEVEVTLPASAARSA